MMHITLFAFLCGILCQTHVTSFVFDESARGWMDEAINSLTGSASENTHTELPIQHTYDPIKDYLQPRPNNDNAMNEEIKNIRESENIENASLQIASHATISSAPPRNEVSGTLGMHPHPSVSNRIDLHQRHAISHEKRALARLDVLCAAFLYAKQHNAIKYPIKLNRASKQFLRNSVLPVVGCLTNHFRLDVERFLRAQRNTLFYSQFRQTKCTGKPGACTLEANVNKKKNLNRSIFLN